MCRCRKEDELSQPTPSDLEGCVSSDCGGRVHRFGCFICGIDFGHCGRKKSNSDRQVDRPARTETKSGVVPPRGPVPPPVTCVRRPRFGDLPRTGSVQKHQRNAVKTGGVVSRRHGADVEAGLPVHRLRKPSDPSQRQHRTLGRPELETVSLSHYYRRHHHRARNHSRAMRQVAEWIENAGVANAGDAEDTAVVRRRCHTRRHVHEHHHHHYHYHYSASGLV